MTSPHRPFYFTKLLVGLVVLAIVVQWATGGPEAATWLPILWVLLGLAFTLDAATSLRRRFPGRFTISRRRGHG
jgi:uncharacterized protein (DUF58 family)